MSRNNPDRTGAHDDQSVPSEVLRKLEFVSPTELVDLPSKGMYPEGHPLAGKQSVEIKFMTAKDEDILTSQSLLKKGVAIERFMQNVLVDKSINTEELYICDRNAILIAARSSGYGSHYEARVNCPNCQTANTLSFDLSDPDVKESVIEEKWNIEQNGIEFLVTTPMTKLKVGLRLLIGRDENYLAQQMADKKIKEEKNVSTQLRLMITSVEGDESRSTIDYYVENMPTQDSRYLRNVYQMVTPSIRIVEDLECHACGHEQEVDVPFGADFFWPDR